MSDLPTQSDFEDFSAWTGRDVLTRDGERLGAVEVIFLDEETDRPEWVLVQLEEGDGRAFVPLAGASVEERSIRVEHDREQVAAAPRIDKDDTLTVTDERRLYDHYGLGYSRDASSTVLPEGADAEGADAPETGTTPPTEERPRLRRYVGAPVPAAGTSENEATGDAASVDAPEPTPAPSTTGTGATTPSPAPIPPPAPQVVPPEGGFQGEDAGATGPSSPLERLKGKPAIPVAVAGAIAGLIAVLAIRRRR